MADQEKDKRMQIDDMLDSLLANYSRRSRGRGWKHGYWRTCARAEEKKASQGWWDFKWIWAGMVTAAIIVAMLLIGGRHRVEPPTHVIVKTNPAVPKPEIHPQTPTVRNETVRIRPRKSVAPTRPQNAALALNERPAVFPTPTPLSEQEKLLLSYLAGTPREEVIAESHPDEPPVVGDQDQTKAIPDLTLIPQKLGNTR